MAPLTFAQAVEALEGALKFGIRPSLEGIRELLEVLGQPQRGVRFVQVTGTNGKTSVVRMTAALLRAHGFATAAYTSPHLESYAERIEVDGAPVSEAVFARGLEAALDAASAAGGEYTEFELLTAAALWLMRDAGVSWGVLEVGMGGQWDATSVVDPEVAVITGIGLDHTERLGATVEAIAADKAHIIKPGGIAVLGPGTVAVRPILQERARDVGAAVVRVDEGPRLAAEVGFRVVSRPSAPDDPTTFGVDGRLGSYDDLALNGPSYQVPNAAVTVAAAECALCEALDPSLVRDTLSHMTFPGRFELVRRDPPLVLDGAHNPQAAAVLAGAIAEAWPDPARRPTLVLGVLADKDAAGIVDALAGVASRFVVTEPRSPRALPAADLAALVAERLGHAPESVEPVPRLAVTAAASGSDGVVVTGSLYLVGELRRELRE